MSTEQTTIWCARRTVLAGAAGVAALGLTGCGGGGGSEARTGAIKTADIPVGGAVYYSDAKVIVAQPTAGDYKAFSSVCTHAGGSVSQIDGAKGTCPLHGSVFNVTTGAVEQGPATTPLEERQVTVSGDTITIA
ncbi:MAG: Rieske (2Fe-2S) protein [Micrococcales bacterium]|nr:Rieske (2Fe-2S) protein [Micrococcales bacterium]